MSVASGRIFPGGQLHHPMTACLLAAEKLDSEAERKKKSPTRVLILLFVLLLLQPRPLLSFVGVVVLFSCRTTLLCLFVYISLQYYYIPATKSTATPVLLIAAPHHHR